MPSASTCSRAAQSGPTYNIAAALRILVCLIIAVALPAQAVSASVERAWNAAHIHVNGDGQESLLTAEAAPALPPHASEHFPMQRLRDIAAGRMGVDVGSTQEAEALHLLAHAQEHSAGTPHHHDADAPDVAYVSDEGSAAPAAAERTGKHNHDGFSPAIAFAANRLPLPPNQAVQSTLSTLHVSHISGPGERPPR